MNIPEKFWKTLMGLTGMLTILAVILVVKEAKSISYVGANPNVSNTINVSGTGEAVAIPDIATFSFSVNETAKTVAEAQTAATNRTNAALKAIKDGGVAEKDIKTTSYSINPHYEYQNSLCTVNSCPPSRSILTGYEVGQTIQVKVRDLGKAGALFATIGGLGVQYVNNLAFSVDNPDGVNAEARAKAITDAQSKAEKLAKQLGVRLVRIISFSENGSPRTPIIYGMGAAKTVSMDSYSPAPQIPVGEDKVVSNVDITYEIR